VVFADTHAPYEDSSALRILHQVIADVHPQIIIDLGDTGDFDSLNPWNRNKRRLQEGKRTKHDVDSMYAVSRGVTSLRDNKKTKYVKFIGNHELWLERYIDEHPELEGFVNLEGDYKEMGWEVIPWGGFYHVGKLMFHHGDRRGYQSKFHAKQWAAMGRSIVYAHVHDVQRWTHETLTRDGSPDKHAAFSIGCLSSWTGIGCLTAEWNGNRALESSTCKRMASLTSTTWI